MIDLISGLAVAIGAFFFFAGTLGLFRLPDVYSRLHALTKADNLGLGFVILGLMLQAPDVLYAGKLFLIWLLVMLSGATGAHLIAKRAIRGDGEDRQ